MAREPEWVISNREEKKVHDLVAECLPIACQYARLPVNSLESLQVGIQKKRLIRQMVEILHLNGDPSWMIGRSLNF